MKTELTTVTELVAAMNKYKSEITEEQNALLSEINQISGRLAELEPEISEAISADNTKKYQTLTQERSFLLEKKDSLEKKLSAISAVPYSKEEYDTTIKKVQDEVKEMESEAEKTISDALALAFDTFNTAERLISNATNQLRRFERETNKNKYHQRFNDGELMGEGISVNMGDFLYGFKSCFVTNGQLIRRTFRDVIGEE